jgi:hypothetical protein
MAKTSLDALASLTIIQGAADRVHHLKETDVLKVPLADRDGEIVIEIDLKEYSMPDREAILAEARKLEHK